MSSIAYFGPAGTFTEQAALSLMAAGDELIAAETIGSALDEVRGGRVDAACVPVENSVEGAVTATLDALARDEPLVGVAETLLPIRFSVLVREECATVRTVASHPHALAQVRRWLADNLPDAVSVAASSTAAAAVAVQRGEYDAAVTAPVAVTHYSLRVHASDVADVTDAATRFLLLRKPCAAPEPTGTDRTSIVAEVDNRPGALSELLRELASRGINLTKLDARPEQRRLGRYRFFIDFEGHLAEPRIADALRALYRRSNVVRFLGSFPRADGVTPTVARNAGNPDFLAAEAWLDAVRKGTTC